MALNETMKFQRFKAALFVLILEISVSPTKGSEITRCCAGGARHYRERVTCLQLNTIGSSQNCARSASICCLRASIESACSGGVEHALREMECTADFFTDVVARATKKECCECCLLATNLVAEHRPCIAGVGFSAACLNSFNKCCRSAQNSTATAVIFDKNNANAPFASESISNYDGISATYNHNSGSIVNDNELSNEFFFHDGASTLPSLASCDLARCDHYCSVQVAENSTECSCRHGYDLAADGRSCLDIDECLLLVDDCLESQRCLNIPGSYKCIRTLSCGTGYAMDSETEQCVDVDECTLGAHNCGKQYQCRNTQGSYRCVPRKCELNEVLNQVTGNCDSIDCPTGYAARNKKCEDIDECQTPNRCNFYDECINLPGSFRCQEKGNLCSIGFIIDRESGFCLDRNECEDGTHTCGLQQCINLPGTFKCRCAAGFEFNETSRICEDVNECEKFAGHSCSLQATCENTIGSFICHCKAGFRLADDGRNCDDIDECANGLAKCQQKCVNTPGSYQCICQPGYQLSADELTCQDIDECATWANSGKQLCMGKCVNTLGGFACVCPAGFEILADNITCKDIDECALRGSNLCIPEEELCVNTLGSYKCQQINCPKNYVRDKSFKNRCVRKANFCAGGFTALERCQKMPIHISWQHIAIARHVNISTQRTSVTLFSMKGPNSVNSSMQFELRLVDARPELSHVTPAIRGNFLLQKGEHHNSAIIALRDSLDGPQEIHLELILRLSTNGRFNGKYVANLVIYVSQFGPQIPYNSDSFMKKNAG